MVKNRAIAFLPRVPVFSLVLGMLILWTSQTFSQSAGHKAIIPTAGGVLSTGNAFVVGTVESAYGLIQVLLPPGTATSDWLDFNQHSYFSASVAGTIFTNNDRAALGPNQQLIGAPDSLFKLNDTIRAVWTKRNGVDIIQDIWPFAFARAGQIVMRWTFRNRNPATQIPVACQWLNDVQINQPEQTHSQYNPRQGGPQLVNQSTDGPAFLSNADYTITSEQFTSSSPVVPWFYMCFLFDLPGPGGSPGLTSLGYIDYPQLGTIKPWRVTIADWDSLRAVVWGANPRIVLGRIFTDDNAILLEFPGTNVGAKPVVGGQTSYGTSDWLTCSGSMYGLVRYPDYLPYDAVKRQYVPTPFKVDFLPVNYDLLNGGVANNLRFSLTVGPHLNIVDLPMTTVFGKTETLPALSAPPLTMPAGAVRELVWWVKADPVYFCKDNFISRLKIAANEQFNGGDVYKDMYDPTLDTCEHLITLQCAETDTLPPLHDVADNGLVPGTKTITVHDDRKTPILDRGLDSVWWKVASGYELSASNFTITLLDSIKPCFEDTLKHRILFKQIDSTIGGCFWFYFLDCMGNLSDTELCFDAHPLPEVKDTLPPVIHITDQFGASDSRPCSVKIDSLVASDFRKDDKHIDSIYVVAGMANNMAMYPTLQHFSPPVPSARFGIHVLDSMLDGDICVRVVDAAKPSNHTDTCFHYCTTPDTLKPLVVISQLGTGLWQIDVYENRPWDRLIDSVFVLYDPTKFTFPPSGFPPTLAQTRRQSHYVFQVRSFDTSVAASFCVAANDLAKNFSDTACTGLDIQPDLLAPNIVFEGDPSGNLPAMEFGINDIHFVGTPANPIRYIWDKGVDSVWFTNIHGIAVPWTSRKFACVDSIPHFTLNVIDTLALDTLNACVTINVVDCAGNASTQDWCYRYARDTFPPLLRAQYVSKQAIRVTVDDSRRADRGNARIATSNEVNLDSYSTVATGQPSTSFVLQRPIVSQSSFGFVSTTDRWGSVFLNDSAVHSASAPMFVRVQDLELKKGEIVTYGRVIDIPVRLVHNDAIPLAEKGITAFMFSFTPSPLTPHLKFVGVNTAGTQTRAGWQVDTLSKGASMVVNAHMLAGGAPLSAPPDTVVYLRFTAAGSDTTEAIVLSIDNINGETVVYNNGLDTTTYGPNSVSVMPPPWGSLEGMEIVIASACSPILGADSLIVTRISLDEPTPNPSSRFASLHYTLAQNGPAQIALFDMLGRQVRMVTDEAQTQGSHTITIDLDGLDAGQYVVRLGTPNGVLTRMLLIRK